MDCPFFILISGPTGVGKTSFVEQLSEQSPLPIEIINADMGQLYRPLSIGTAKPDLTTQKVPHHLFNIIDDPRDFTARAFRDRVALLLNEITERGAVPVIVGGSLFYLSTLFYPPQKTSVPRLANQFVDKETDALWQELYDADAKRAQEIHRHDRYRIVRALELLYSGVQPSQIRPTLDPAGSCAFYFLLRDREELVERNRVRIDQMFMQGWVSEVEQLSADWHEYLKNKKIIGYREICEYLENGESDLAQVKRKIWHKTNQYAKRQITFWKQLKKKLEADDPQGTYLKKLTVLNLTLSPYDLYLKQLIQELKKLKLCGTVNEK